MNQDKFQSIFSKITSHSEMLYLMQLYSTSKENTEKGLLAQRELDKIEKSLGC